MRESDVQRVGMFESPDPQLSLVVVLVTRAHDHYSVTSLTLTVSEGPQPPWPTMPPPPPASLALAVAMAQPAAAAIPTLYDLVLDSLAKDTHALSFPFLAALPPALLPSVYDYYKQRHALTLSSVLTFRPLLSHFTSLSLSAVKGLNDLSLLTLSLSLASVAALDLSLNNSIGGTDSCLSLPCPRSLTSLNVSGCRRLGDSALVPLLARCPNLRSLDASFTNIKDRTLVALARTPTSTNSDSGNGLLALTHLNVANNMLYSGLAPLLARRPPLRYLNVSATLLSDSDLELVSNLSETLTEFHCEFAVKVTDAGLAGLRECSKLIVLNVARNSNLSASTLNALRALGQLMSLNYSANDLVYSKSLHCLASLTELDLQRCSALTDPVARQLLTLNGLERLNVMYSSITNAFIDDLIRAFPRLKVLKVTRCQINDHGIKRFFAPHRFHSDNSESDAEDSVRLLCPVFAPSLVRLDIGGELLTDACCSAIVTGIRHFPSLQSFGIWTTGITRSGIQPLLTESSAVRLQFNALSITSGHGNVSQSVSLYDDSDSESESASAALEDSRIVGASQRFELDPTMNSSPGTFVLIRNVVPMQ